MALLSPLPNHSSIFKHEADKSDSTCHTPTLEKNFKRIKNIEWEAGRNRKLAVDITKKSMKVMWDYWEKQRFLFRFLQGDERVYKMFVMGNLP